MSKTKGTKPSRKQLKARIRDLEQRNFDLARTVGQLLAQGSHLGAVVKDYGPPTR
jgi:hypothetical protein